MIHPNLSSLVGNTPLVVLGGFSALRGLPQAIVGKLERVNPSGSVKDRAALGIIEDAERQGRLKPGGTIIEPTSGNTGIGLAALAAARGYRVVLTMPDNMSLERQQLIRAYGAEIVLTPAAAGMQGALDRADALHRETPGSIVAGQFVNPANPAYHYRTTGPELWRGTAGAVAVFVAGVGSGGTLSGAGRFLKEQNAAVELVAVEPARSPLLSGGAAGPHGIQGIGANFVPGNFSRDFCDRIVPVADDDAIAAARDLARADGLLCGISSGAACFAAATLAALPEYRDKLIVALLPDTGERYLSSGLFE